MDPAVKPGFKVVVVSAAMVVVPVRFTAPEAVMLASVEVPVTANEPLSVASLVLKVSADRVVKPAIDEPPLFTGGLAGIYVTIEVVPTTALVLPPPLLTMPDPAGPCGPAGPRGP